MRKISILLSLALFLPFSASALECTSANADATGCTSSSNTAADCTALGYSLQKIADCAHELSCPFNTSYKICVDEPKEVTECPTGYTTDKPNAASCGTAYGWSWLHGGQLGDKICGKCTCDISECKWTSSNKGTATVSNICCDGTHHKTCTSTCKEVTVPANATPSQSCTGCGKTVTTAFNCNSGYTKSADGKSCVKEPEIEYYCNVSYGNDSTCSDVKINGGKYYIPKLTINIPQGCQIIQESGAVGVMFKFTGSDCDGSSSGGSNYIAFTALNAGGNLATDNTGNTVYMKLKKCNSFDCRYTVQAMPAVSGMRSSVRIKCGSTEHTCSLLPSS